MKFDGQAQALCRSPVCRQIPGPIQIGGESAGGQHPAAGHGPGQRVRVHQVLPPERGRIPVQVPGCCVDQAFQEIIGFRPAHPAIGGLRRGVGEQAAHANVGGAYAGAPQYDYERGPNGVNYAVSGHVDIDISEVSGNPEATLAKMLVVQRAALAPANPSPQDRAVAAEAAQKATQARAEIADQTASLATERVSRPRAANDATAGGYLDVRV